MSDARASEGSPEAGAAPRVGVIMGSSSDWETMRNAAVVLERFGVAHEVRVVSAHRTPDLLVDYATSAADRGLQVIIAGAGGAAHLPGMVAGHTLLPVVGVPIRSQALQGLDSLLSIVQMPAGVPVATMAIGPPGATNAGLFAVALLALHQPGLGEALTAFRAERAAEVAPTHLPWPEPHRTSRDVEPAGAAREVTPRDAPILPGATIGIFGSGQLGRMLASAARAMGYQVAVYSDDHSGQATPAGQLADSDVHAAYDHPVMLPLFARGIDVATTEFENVPAAALAAMEAAGVPARPGPAVVEVAQHRAREKRAFAAAGLATVRWSLPAPRGSAIRRWPRPPPSATTARGSGASTAPTTSPPGCPTCAGVELVYEERVEPGGRVLGARRPRPDRRAGRLPGDREPPPRRHPRLVGGPRPPAPAR